MKTPVPRFFSLDEGRDERLRLARLSPAAKLELLEREVARLQGECSALRAELKRLGTTPNSEVA